MVKFEILLNCLVKFSFKVYIGLLGPSWATLDLMGFVSMRVQPHTPILIRAPLRQYPLIWREFGEADRSMPSSKMFPFGRNLESRADRLSSYKQYRIKTKRS